MYALIAIGYTMVYGVLRLINFAHADIMMVGAFVAFFCLASFGMPFFAAVIFSIVLSGLLGYSIDKIAYKPLREAPRISVLITAIGMSFFLENLFNVLFGSTPKAFPVPELFEKFIIIGGISFSFSVVVVPIVTVLLLLLVLYILYRTKHGMAIRAVAFDVNTVRLMGGRCERRYLIRFCFGERVCGNRWDILCDKLSHHRAAYGGAHRSQSICRGGTWRDRKRYWGSARWIYHRVYGGDSRSLYARARRL